MEKTILTSFICKPATQNSKKDDYNLKIPRKLIRTCVVDPTKYYEVQLKELNNSKEEIK